MEHRAYICIYGTFEKPAYQFVEEDDYGDRVIDVWLKPNKVRLTLPENCTGRRSVAVKDVKKYVDADHKYIVPNNEKVRTKRVTLKSQREQLQARVLARAERMLNERLKK